MFTHLALPRPLLSFQLHAYNIAMLSGYFYTLASVYNLIYDWSFSLSTWGAVTALKKQTNKQTNSQTDKQTNKNKQCEYMCAAPTHCKRFQVWVQGLVILDITSNHTPLNMRILSNKHFSNLLEDPGYIIRS